MMPLTSGPIDPDSSAIRISEKLLQESAWTAFQLCGTPSRARPHMTKGCVLSSRRDASASAAMAATPGPLNSQRSGLSGDASAQLDEKPNNPVTRAVAATPAAAVDQTVLMLGASFLALLIVLSERFGEADRITQDIEIYLEHLQKQPVHVGGDAVPELHARSRFMISAVGLGNDGFGSVDAFENVDEIAVERFQSTDKVEFDDRKATFVVLWPPVRVHPGHALARHHGDEFGKGDWVGQRDPLRRCRKLDLPDDMRGYIHHQFVVIGAREPCIRVPDKDKFECIGVFFEYVQLLRQRQVVGARKAIVFFLMTVPPVAVDRETFNLKEESLYGRACVLWNRLVQVPSAASVIHVVSDLLRRRTKFAGKVAPHPPWDADP